MTAGISDAGLQRWLAPLLGRLPVLDIFDAHAHLGADCDGTVCEPAALTTSLDLIAARAVVFPLHIANGDYRADNDAVIAAADASAGRWVPFARLNPHRDAVVEGRRAIAEGARGIKLHPRAETFTLAHPAVEEIVALAHEHRLPVLIHAGRGIDPLGADALRLAARHPDATLILAHAAITDLAWLPAVLDDHPNVLFDTAWWNPVDLVTLFTHVPPGRIVFGSDVPFGEPTLNAFITLRCALAAGLEPDALVSVMGAQLARVLEGRPPADLGPAGGAPRLRRRDPLLDRALIYLAAVWGAAIGGGDPTEPLQLAHMALDLSPDHPDHEIAHAAGEALASGLPELRGLAGLAIAACLLATPHVSP